MTARPARPAGTCSRCPARMVLTDKGLMPPHVRNLRSNLGRSQVPCYGAGKPPETPKENRR